MLGFQALCAGALNSGGPPPSAAATVDSTVLTPGGAGGYAETWRTHWQDKWHRDTRRAALLALIHDSEGYKKAWRRLQMLREHLLMAVQYKDQRKAEIIRDKIEDLENEIRMMERFD